MAFSVTYRDEIFVVENASREEGKLFSARQGGVGWRFHGSYCKGHAPCCKAKLPDFTWWTNEAIKARPFYEQADKAAREVIDQTNASINLSRAADADVELPCPEGLSYYPFQKAGIAYGITREATLIADEMGLGKTIQALGIANATDAKTILVICPASLRINWLREAQTWLCRQRESYVVTASKSKGKPVEIPASAELVIANYDLVWRKGIFEQLMSREWDLLILDEAHYCKNARGAKRAKAVLGTWDKKASKKVAGLVDVAERRVFLTGTPIPNGNAMEAWPLLQALKKGEWGSWMYYAKRYAGAYKQWIGRGTVWAFDPESAKGNLGELQQKMRAAVMVRRTKDQVLKELPPKRHQLIVLPQNGSAKLVKAEDKLLGSVKAEMAAAVSAGNYEAALSCLEEISGLPFETISKMRSEMAAAKVDGVKAHVDELLAETRDDGTQAVPKVLVFAHHHLMIDALVEHYGTQAVKLDGRMDQDARQVSVDRFQGDPSVRVFIGQIAAAGVGLTLTAGANVVFSEMDWVPGNMQQAEDRAHRIGQTESVLVQHLVVDGTIDAMVAQLLRLKSARSDLALDTEVSEIDMSAMIAEAAAAAEEGTKRREAAAKGRKTLVMKVVGSEDRLAALGEAMRVLSGMCDGAVERDDCGFNGGDTGLGKALAPLPSDCWTERQVLWAVRALPKYHRQLGETLTARLRGKAGE